MVRPKKVKASTAILMRVHVNFLLHDDDKVLILRDHVFPLAATIKKFYNQGAFLYRVACRDEVCCKIFDEILLSLQPMEFFPFELSIDFEVKQREAALQPSSLVEGSPKGSPALRHHVAERPVTTSEVGNGCVNNACLELILAPAAGGPRQGCHGNRTANQ